MPLVEVALPGGEGENLAGTGIAGIERADVNFYIKEESLSASAAMTEVALPGGEGENLAGTGIAGIERADVNFYIKEESLSAS